ncbi:MAG: hypothetical protein IK119_06830 [Bacteroidales bacterium]|nr:hypothetical protein [Bacteroidales bacterium]
MKKWEEIIKDKMEGYDSPLPEGSLAEFRALRNGAAVKPAARRFPLVWVLAPALAAGLAAVLLLRQPSVQENGIQVVSQPAAPVVAASMPATPKPAVQRAVANNEVVQEDIVQYVDASEEVVPAEEVQTEETVPQETVSADSAVSSVLPVSPYIPQDNKVKPVKIKVAPVAAAVAGGGLLAALLTPSNVKKNDLSLPDKFRYLSSANYNRGGSLTESQYGDPQSSPTTPPEQPGDVSAPEEPKDVFTGVRSHKTPFRTGISGRVPLSERLYLTTGLEYSRYESAFRYSLSGNQTQIAQYIGVPVRLDWTLASGRWLDVYLGAGIGSDYCINATLGGKQIVKDGFSFSLLGAGGIQFNLTERLGLYVEPGLRYTIPSESRVLETYRTVKPMYFSVSSGIRIGLGSAR